MYSIKKVSELLGIPAVTIRAWENRYRIISPARSDGRHRLYSEDDIRTLQWLKKQIDENGLKVSEAVRLLERTNRQIPATEEAVPPKGQPDEELLQRLYEDLIELNSSQAHERIDMAFALYHYSDVFHRIFHPVLYRVGTAWENGEITVAQEHFASQLIMHRCTQFLRVFPIRSNLPKVLSLCPEGEHHQMGLMLFSLFLREKGVEVIYLGPDTPFYGLDELIEKKGVSMVALSITDDRLADPVGRWIMEKRAQKPGLAFVLGGAGFENCADWISPYVLPENRQDWEKWYLTAFPHSPPDVRLNAN
ncbi:MerR family transcriptional regulator [Cohnella candidum]|uniref:MerR family transcriptional regulator n=1 Tax=Cohnella candidum TaxID=2674991 RepID=A0A3G3K2U3_9BACL|nr:MerR family transcriptional regulator [Cohnella candidum]AYQ74377.1 MerR family transcriptional regulator [Cohnella candidum]